MQTNTHIDQSCVGYMNNDVSFEGENGIPQGCVFSGKIDIGKYTTLGINNMLFGNVSLGRYCQIGANVAFHATNHPIYHMTTYINYRLFNGELKQFKESKPISIGNDVWIGHGAIILSGVTVGDGVIIGAGSVVTKDIPAYAIAVGNPAKVINYRFSDNIIKEIEKLKWWDLSCERLNEIKPLFMVDLKNKQSIYSNDK